MTRRARTARLRILSWNIWVGNTPAVVRAALILLAGLFRPHLICLQEARRFTGTIPGYRRLAADEARRKHATNNIVLVRRGVPVPDHGPQHVPGDGWTYDGNPKPPRTFYGVVLPRRRVTWHVLDVHRCVGGPRGNSPEEWQLEDDTIVEWASQVPAGHPLAIVGDHNDRGEYHRPGTTLDLADRLEARVLTPGDTIDYALIRRCGGVIRELARTFRSNHAPTLITLTAPRPPRESLITRRTTTEQNIPLPG